MRIVQGSNRNEAKMITAIQSAIGVKADGMIGTATVCELANQVHANCWPITLSLYGQPVIVCKDISVCNPKASCGYFKNSLSGSFSYQRKPCSILINNGETIGASACHAWLGQPESVLYKLTDGTIGIKRVTYVHELPSNVVWAVGGVGLLDSFDPKTEGFYGKYADVLRKTDHTVLGVKNNMLYLVYCHSMTGFGVNSFCKNKLRLDLAVMLDGGHVAAINGDESFAKINTRTTQWYMLQAK